MVKVSEHLQGKKSPRSKQGFGIVEVLIAAAVLGFLYVAILNLQGGNRDALLRIRGRDGATEVAQSIIDSLGALGIANLTDDKLKNGAGVIQPIIIDPIKRTWEGQPGVLRNKMTVDYRAEVTVSPDAEYMANTGSMLLSAMSSSSYSHVYAKRLDVKVSWHFKNSIQSITVSGVIR